jgi:ATP-binding cassette subfamily B protein/subfamily B ATP-binding cassette protein MsbA
MKNFLRVVRLTLRRRYTFAAAVICSVGVAFLWGGNLAMIRPIVEIVFTDKQPHAWADDKVADAKAKLAKTDQELDQLAAQLNQALPDQRAALKLKQARLQQRRAIEAKAVQAAEFLQPLVHKHLPNSKFFSLTLFVGLLIVATLVKSAMLVGHSLLVDRLTQLAMFDMRNQLFRQTLKIEMAHFGDGHSSHMMHRITSDVQCAFNGVNVLCGRMILEPLKMLACLFGAAMICWRLLAVSLLVAPLAAYVLVRLTKSLRKANRRAMEEMGSLYTVLSETLTNMQTVKAFGMERHEQWRYHQSGKKCFHRAMRIVLFNSLGRASAEVMGITIICMAIVVGAYLVLNQQTTLLGIPIMDQPLSLGSLMAFYALLAGISDPARKMSEVMGTFQRGIAAADRIYDIADYQPKIVDPKEPKSLVNPRPEIVFDRVAFQYSTGQRVLHDVNLRVPFGETVAIVGPNGCGKTTLVNLLPRFYDPVEGAVRLDGIDLRELRMKDLRAMIGLVAQQGMLFDDTVMNNIRYGSPSASEEQVVAAAEKAFAHRFIVERLDKGYKTEVGERGGRLSGGQRQRILLARAILRDPKFLILDEATSQIDLESEQLIHKVLEQFTRGRTTLLITHRMSSIALANRIVVMDAGRIIDSGSHDELISRCDLYRRLHQISFQQAA